MKRKPIPIKIRMALWNSQCAVCGSKKDSEIDHIVPVFFGGKTDPNNLQNLCRRHNRLKEGMCKRLRRPVQNWELLESWETVGVV